MFNKTEKQNPNCSCGQDIQSTTINQSAPTAHVKRNNKPYIKALSFKAEDFCK